jgi:hypothetical protein
MPLGFQTDDLNKLRCGTDGGLRRGMNHDDGTMLDLMRHPQSKRFFSTFFGAPGNVFEQHLQRRQPVCGHASTLHHMVKTPSFKFGLVQRALKWPLPKGKGRKNKGKTPTVLITTEDVKDQKKPTDELIKHAKKIGTRSGHTREATISDVKKTIASAKTLEKNQGPMEPDEVIERGMVNEPRPRGWRHGNFRSRSPLLRCHSEETLEGRSRNPSSF